MIKIKSKKLTKSNIYAIIALVIVIGVSVLLPFGAIDIETFWVVTGLVFVFAFFIMPRMQLKEKFPNGIPEEEIEKSNEELKKRYK